MSRYSVIFCAFFARAKNGDCSPKCRGHHTMTAQSAARTTSPSKLSRVIVVFLEQLSFSAAVPCGRHYFSHHRLSWHCRFKFKHVAFRGIFLSTFWATLVFSQATAISHWTQLVSSDSQENAEDYVDMAIRRKTKHLDVSMVCWNPRLPFNGKFRVQHSQHSSIVIPGKSATDQSHTKKNRHTCTFRFFDTIKNGDMYIRLFCWWDWGFWVT